MIKVNSAKIINTNSFSLLVAHFPESTRKGTDFIQIQFSPQMHPFPVIELLRFLGLSRNSGEISLGLLTPLVIGILSSRKN